MSKRINIHANGMARWIDVPQSGSVAPSTIARCNRDYLQACLAHIEYAQVIDAVLNDSGEAIDPPVNFEIPNVPSHSGVTISGVPPHFEVTAQVQGQKHVTTIKVWLPVDWNGRFLGVGGGGNRTMTALLLPDWIRMSTLVTAVRNGFAVACTDGGNRDSRFVEWGLIEETREVDWELTNNWVHHSTHEMTLIGKAITKAIYAEAPEYSYFVGTSGGGRQALVEAQRYPDDYDGIWANDPAIHWNRFIPAALWPALVMERHGVALHPAKLDAFRAAAIRANDGRDGLIDGIIGAFEPCDFDPRLLVGQDTADGPITAGDAEVMQKIWDGPRRASDGSFLWYGLRPDIESWGRNGMGLGICMTTEQNGNRCPESFAIADGYLRAWVVRDPEWRWQSMSFDDYEALFDRSVAEMSSLASNDPDLRSFCSSGGKLLLSHGAADQLIMPQGTVDYYRAVIDCMGTLGATREFARLFVSDGDGHSSATPGGWGMLLADGMAALMKWVEHGETPDMIPARKVDLETSTVSGARPVFAYPLSTRYSGHGDPEEITSYLAVSSTL